jgi:hypothetical protein
MLTFVEQERTRRHQRRQITAAIYQLVGFRRLSFTKQNRSLCFHTIQSFGVSVVDAVARCLSFLPSFVISRRDKPHVRRGANDTEEQEKQGEWRPNSLYQNKALGWRTITYMKRSGIRASALMHSAAVNRKLDVATRWHSWAGLQNGSEKLAGQRSKK